ncbi:hypothetical protein GCM10023310_72200 [Paenibacillus vulneris]|uniref:Uncharacterized protein n=1 Tax=Paenibacillus vulneris TaxID=1133364 RepID=A0ABW3UGK1_9BACL
MKELRRIVIAEEHTRVIAVLMVVQPAMIMILVTLVEQFPLVQVMFLLMDRELLLMEALLQNELLVHLATLP